MFEIITNNIEYIITKGLCHSIVDMNLHIMICNVMPIIDTLPSLILKLSNNAEFIINWDSLFKISMYEGKQVYVST